jgi:hypothetical protein
MKKTLITLFLITLISGVLRAQDRATTVEEYNYLRRGAYNTILPGHTLRPSIVNLRLSYMMTGDRTCRISEFYRDGSSNPCAIVLILGSSGDGENAFIPVPDYNSDPSLWNAYKEQLSSLSLGGNELTTIAYALAKYAASH